MKREFVKKRIAILLTIVMFFGMIPMMGIGIKRVSADAGQDALEGLTWTVKSTEANTSLRAISYGNGTFLTVGIPAMPYTGINGPMENGDLYRTSSNGETWTSQSTGTPHQVWGLTYGNNQFVSVGYYMELYYGQQYYHGKIMRSSDGVTWSDKTLDKGYRLFGVAYGNSGFVAVGESNDINYNTTQLILTSPDGEVWTPRGSGESGALNGITYANGLFVAVGNSGTILTSTDGVTWTPSNSTTTKTLRGVSYFNGLYVAVGNSGTILTSTDGKNWISGTSPVNTTLRGATYGDGTYVIVGHNGTILSSTDGVNWVSRTSGTNVALYGVIYNNDAFIAVGENGTILVSQYKLSYTAGPNGSVTGAVSQSVTPGSSGTEVTAVPDAGYHFVNWSDGVTTASRTDSNVNGDINVTANFAIDTVNEYTLTYTAGPNGGVTGAVYQSVTPGSSGTEVTAVPNAGYHFVNWSDGVTTASRTDSNVSGDINVTANFAINRTSSSGNGSNSPSQPVAEVLINGKTETLGTATVSIKGKQTVTTITFDPLKMEQRFTNLDDNTVVTISVNTKSDIVIGELTGQMIKNMEQKGMEVVINTDYASYTLPTKQINISALSEQFGNSVDLQKIKVQIEISKSTEDTVRIVENSADNSGYTIVVPPLDFTVRATYGDTTIEIAKFNGYVERTIAIPDGVDPSKITTAIVVDPDGIVRHVPTKIVVIEGKYFAVVNSLTNSTYSVIWHSMEFKDVENHWAKNAVNEMGSRMVIRGVGNDLFNPDQDITRAEFAAIMIQALGLKQENGSNSFVDLKETDWYNGFIQTAFTNQLISGFEDGKFRPTDRITREQAMVLIAKAMKKTGLQVNLEANEAEELLSQFSDTNNVSEWAKNSIVECIQSGIVSGRDGKQLAPKESISRAEVAVIVQKLLQKSGLI